MRLRFLSATTLAFPLLLVACSGKTHEDPTVNPGTEGEDPSMQMTDDPTSMEGDGTGNEGTDPNLPLEPG